MGELSNNKPAKWGFVGAVAFITVCTVGLAIGSYPEDAEQINACAAELDDKPMHVSDLPAACNGYDISTETVHGKGYDLISAGQFREENIPAPEMDWKGVTFAWVGGVATYGVIKRGSENRTKRSTK